MNRIEKAVIGATLMLAGLGVEHVAEMTGVKNVKVDSMNISPAQAAMIQGNLDYDTEPSPLPKFGKRRKD